MHTNVLSRIFVGLLCFEIVFNSVSGRGNSEYGRQAKTCACGRSLLGLFAVPDRDVSHTRIINGDVVKPVFKYPWMVSISKKNQHFCGGAIIGPNKVLTAAHCVLQAKSTLPPNAGPCIMFDDGEKYCPTKVKDLTVRYIGVAGLSKPISVTDARYSRQFTTKGNLYDIAILTTDRNFPCNQYTAPICLPASSDLNKPGTKVIIAGWGQSTVGLENLSEGKLYLEASVEIKLMTKYKKPDSCPQTSSDDHFCTQGNRQNSCYGDSGGPAFVQRKGVFYAVGISSWGTSQNCNFNSFEYYTNVFKFLPWIRENMNSKFSQNEYSRSSQNTDGLMWSLNGKYSNSWNEYSSNYGYGWY